METNDSNKIVLCVDIRKIETIQVAREESSNMLEFWDLNYKNKDNFNSSNDSSDEHNFLNPVSPVKNLKIMRRQYSFEKDKKKINELRNKLKIAYLEISQLKVEVSNKNKARQVNEKIIATKEFAKLNEVFTKRTVEMQYAFVKETNSIRNQHKDQKAEVRDMHRLVFKLIKYILDQEIKILELRSQLNIKLNSWKSLKFK